MEVGKRTYLFIFLTIIALVTSPVQTFADGKHPVRITNQNMVVYPANETTVQVVQSMAVKNSSSQKEEQLAIYLPEEYTDLQLGEGIAASEIEETGEGIVYNPGLAAGEEKQLLVSYKMPMNNSTSNWRIKQAYLTEKIQVVVQAGVLSFSASNLVTQSDLFEMNGREFRRFTRVDLHPNEPWQLSFQLLETAGQNTAGNEEAISQTEPGAKYTEDGLKVIGSDAFGYGKAVFTIIVIVVALAAALIGLKRDLLKTTGGHRKVKRSWLVEEKTLLLQEIVQLEKDYQSNLVTDKTYQNTRKKIREHLTRIMMELNQESLK